MIARIVSFSVHQRWLVVLFVAMASVFGGWSLAHLPIDAVPDITNRQVQVNARAAALSANEMEKQVTYPIENAIAGIPGLEYRRSLSRNGFAQVTAVFSDRTDIYFARQQITERLADAREEFPPGVEAHMGPISTGLSEIYMWTVHFKKDDGSETRRDGEPGPQRDGSYLTPEGALLRTNVEKEAYLRTVQDWIIKPQLRTIEGVAGVDSLGGYVKQYLVQPDPAKIYALGLSFSDIAAAIERNNTSRGANYVERSGESFVVRSGGRLETIEDVAAVVVVTRDAVPIRIADIAEVAIGGELRTGSASMNGEEVVIGTALMLIGGNSRTIAGAVDTKMREIAKSLPPGVEAKTILDRTALVDATIRTVASNLLEGAALVILVLFALLGNFRAALITATVIPVTMALLATGMIQARISANLMSLGALDFGLIADGAVIIAENCLRHLAERRHGLGRDPTLDERLQTIIASAEEMIRPTVFGQLIIIIVYVPMLTFSGVEGKMFEPMAMTVIIALVSAFILSLTFVPAMIAIVISGRVDESDNAIVRRMKDLYRPLLTLATRQPKKTIAFGVGVFVVSLLLAGRLGQEFIPTLDEKNIAMQASRIPSVSLTQSQAMQFEIENAIRALPEVAYVFSKTGTAEIASDPMPPNMTDTFIMLKPQKDWPDPKLPKDELVARIRGEVDELLGNLYEFSQPIQIRFNELLAGVRGDIAVKVFGDDFDTMLKSANQIAAILRGVPGAVDVKVEQVEGLPLLDIKIDKRAIARLGLTLASAQDVIGAAIGGQQAGVIFEGDRRFPIVVRLQDRLRDDIKTMENIPVALPERGARPAPTIPLKQIAKLSIGDGQNQISRENGKRRVVVTANVRGRDIASVVDEARAEVDAKVAIPTGYWIAWGGQFENLAAARARLAVVVPACFFLIFLLLYSALGGVRDALVVFSAVPLALSGGVAALWLRGMPMSVSAAVGFIALSGIAVLNGLVMRTYIRQLIERGLSSRDAIFEGAMTRLRPVAMTALVASLGFVPMAIATGAGAEVQKPIATVVIGGLISATLLTLVVLPALYTIFGDGGGGTTEPSPLAAQPFRRTWRIVKRPAALVVLSGMLVGGVGASQCRAETLERALALAYRASPVINSSRAALRAEDENVPRALSQIRPRARADGFFGVERRRSVQNATEIVNGNYLQPDFVQSFQNNGALPRTAILTVEQPLFDGFKTLNSVRAAETGVFAGRERLRSIEQRVLFDAVVAYMNVLRDTAALRLQENNVAVLAEQLRQVKERLTAGELTATDVSQAEARLSGGQAQAAAARGALESSKGVYRQIIGEEPKRLSPAKPVDRLLPATEAEAERLAQREHPLILAALHSADAAEFDVKVIESEFWPTLSMIGNIYTQSDIDGRGNRAVGAKVLGRVSVPLYSGGELSARTRQAKEVVGQKRFDADAARAELIALMRANWGSLQASRTQLRAARSQIEAAERALYGVREEAKAGRRTTIEILNAQRELLDSRVALLFVQRDQVVASYAVLAATGRLSAVVLGLPVIGYEPALHFEQVKDSWGGTTPPP
ncbi:hypothetical protein C5688_18690 [Methylocystis sp. MitZ-2018]|nr:hypothetical protein C5688_18690 [Methylocystis sp. MitZ-2018]